MSLRDWFAERKRARELVDPERIRRDMPDGLWTKCSRCEQAIYNKDLEANLLVCPKCDHHFRVPARARIEQLTDEGSFEERFQEIRSADPLGFTDTKPYAARIKESYARLGAGDGVITGQARIDGHPVQLAVMDFAFMGGSMGSVVGEKITRSIEAAMEAHRPLLVVTASGGARMQEGTLSLMQMAKTAAALGRFHDNGNLYISVLADPTTGGVSASFAMLADLIIAEPGATIGFAGRRVIEQTIRQKTPPEFQTAEWLARHGNLDMIVPRHKLRNSLGHLLKLHSRSPVREQAR
ncbi:MAG: acetyl-CoA carboxylase carboxyltransferase subunit beta [Candidatus Sericytochromatia bacterium]|nr:acetyl-CoA carboxylase carboxyltransferase subunit beta [Candidatus Tanganyikabacteria bacterium]